MSQTYIIGTTLRWTVQLYDADGLPVDADSTPTVTLRINQAATAQTASITKRDATTGLYDASAALAGISPGDLIAALVAAEIDEETYTQEYQWTAQPNPMPDLAAIQQEQAEQGEVLDAIKVKTDLISPGAIHVSAGSHIADDGETLELVQGDAYLKSINNGIQIRIRDDRITAAVLSDGTRFWLIIDPKRKSLETVKVEGLAADASFADGALTLIFEMTSDESSKLPTVQQCGAIYSVQLWRQGDPDLPLTPEAGGDCRVTPRAGV